MIKKIIALILVLGCIYYVNTSPAWANLITMVKEKIQVVTESELYETITESLKDSLTQLIASEDLESAE